MTKQEMNRLIAEQCDGLIAIDNKHAESRDHCGEYGWPNKVCIEDYFSNIESCLRAAQRWRRNRQDYRGFRLLADSCRDTNFEVEAWDYGDSKVRRSRKQSESFSEALALALVEVLIK